MLSRREKKIKYENKMAKHKRRQKMKKWRSKLLKDAHSGDVSARENLLKYFNIKIIETKRS